jgi:hypothetical protein
VSGFTFDLVLAAALVVLGLWEAVVAYRQKNKKKVLVILLALFMAAVLLWLRLS